MQPQHVPILLHQAVMRCLREKLIQANQKLNKVYHEPSLSYQLRGTRAGVARPKEWQIRLNPVLLIENRHIFIEQVIPHELAHLLVYKIFGLVPPHGSDWRWMMEHILETPAITTHRFNVQNTLGKTISYQCACQIHSLSLRRHRNITSGRCLYHCKRCGQQLIEIPRQADK